MLKSKRIGHRMMAAILLLSMVLTFVQFLPIEVFAEKGIDQNSLKMLTTARDMSKAVDIHAMDTYPIFDYTKPGFNNLFVAVDIPEGDVKTLTGRSKAEINSAYKEKSVFKGSGKIEVPIQGVDASVGISSSFDTSCQRNLNNVKDELYEYWEKNIYTRVLRADWTHVDNIEQYFSASFVRELEDVEGLEDAVDFLGRYGTHVFDQYFLGGKLMITSYIVSELNIEDVYTEKNMEVSLEAKIGKALEANGQGSSYNLKNDFVSDQTTQASTSMKNWGGKPLDALTVENLFANRGVIVGDNAGFMYSTWIDSVKPGENEVIIDADRPVAIWDIIENSTYRNAERSALLRQAFDILCYINYVEFCRVNAIENNIIEDIVYIDENGIEVTVGQMDEGLRLPSGVVAEMSLGDIITDGDVRGGISLEITKAKSYAQLNGTTLRISEGANGKTIGLSLSLFGIPIYSFDLKVEDADSTYSGGYGTSNQPYLIADADQFKSFLSSGKSKAYYKLINDIDMEGAVLEPAFARGFDGELDGSGHTIYNFSVISAALRTNTGLISVNLGTIKDLTLENVRCINSGILKADEINVGVLVAYNRGVLADIEIYNASVFAVVQLEKASHAFNTGVLCGKSDGVIDRCAVSDCHLLGQTWNKKGEANLGGLVGQISKSTVDLSYVRQTEIYNKGTEAATNVRVGGLVGNIAGASKISKCIVYGNAIDKVDADSFGYMAGKTADKEAFNNCYVETSTNKIVEGVSISGCESRSKLSRSHLNSTMKKYWTVDADNKLVLKEN